MEGRWTWQANVSRPGGDGVQLPCIQGRVEAAVREELHCNREQGNRQGPFTVAIVSRLAPAVGHILIEEDIVCVLHVSLKGWCNKV